MKTAILTLSPRVNYGGILQAYALQTVLERLGHEAEVLDTPTRFRRENPVRLAARMLKRLLKKLAGRRVRITGGLRREHDYRVVSRYTSEFVARRIRRRELSDLRALTQAGFDAVVVGSDQVLRPMYFADVWHTDISEAYLGFLGDGVRKVAYAASFGTDKWEYNPEQSAAAMIGARKFSFFGVREASAVELCRQRLDIDAVQVLDPTMLLNADDYRTLIKEVATEHSAGKMLCYVLDRNEQTQNAIDRLAETTGFAPFYAGVDVNNEELPLADRIQPPVEQWLRGFDDAEMVVTDSFHACVFAMIFGKPFVCLGNEARGMARFDSLLRQFGQGHRLINVSRPLPELAEMIKPADVSERLAELRRASVGHLRKALGGSGTKGA